MTSPIPTDLVERVALAIERADNQKGYDYEHLRIDHPEVSDWGIHLALAAIEATGVEHLQSQLTAAMGSDWFDKAIRDHEAEHGPSGGAWNISMILERLHRAHAALKRMEKGE